MADRNSASPIHSFSTTSTSRDHADSPPPNEASAMWLNVHASSNSDTLSGPASTSLMHEVVVVREVVLVVLRRIERIRRLVVVRRLPVAVEHLLQPPDDGRVIRHDAQLAAQVERASVDVHRADEGAMIVDHDELRVYPQVLLF